jgi:hypothetical protein
MRPHIEEEHGSDVGIFAPDPMSDFFSGMASAAKRAVCCTLRSVRPGPPAGGYLVHGGAASPPASVRLRAAARISVKQSAARAK